MLSYDKHADSQWKKPINGVTELQHQLVLMHMSSFSCWKVDTPGTAVLFSPKYRVLHPGKYVFTLSKKHIFWIKVSQKCFIFENGSTDLGKGGVVLEYAGLGEQFEGHNAQGPGVHSGIGRHVCTPTLVALDDLGRCVRGREAQRRHLAYTSVAVSAEMLLRSPRRLFVYIIKLFIFNIKI